MSVIKNYKDFFKSRDIDEKTIKFINGDLTESQFISYLNEEIINESVIDTIKTKIINILGSFINKSKELGFKIFDKLKSILNWIIEKLENFKKKNPTLYKVITITVIIVVIMIISTSSAQAAISGNPIPVDKIDMAIGLLEKLRATDSVDFFDGAKAIAHLVDIRDGSIDLPDLGPRAIEIANAAIKSVEKIGSEAVQTGDKTTIDTCLSLMEKGNSVLSAVIEKIGPTEKVRLIYK
jgi:hypothetical protein